VTHSATWTGTLTATSSIAHGGETAATISLLRREQILTPDGQLIHIPIVSGNALRGRLRRTGEQLLRQTLRYETQLPLAAAHALRGGGSLAKVSGEPLSGDRLRRVRALVPQVAVFGCAAGGRIISGALQVGKLIPHLAETEHLTGQPGPAMFTATQLETYTRADELTELATDPAVMPVDELGRADLSALADAATFDGRSSSMLFRVETLPAGTRLSSWLHLRPTTAVAAAFFADVVAEFTAHGHVGGRIAIGHGRVKADWTRTDHGDPPQVDWRAELLKHRDDVLDAIATLT